MYHARFLYGTFKHLARSRNWIHSYAEFAGVLPGNGTLLLKICTECARISTVHLLERDIYPWSEPSHTYPHATRKKKSRPTSSNFQNRDTAMSFDSAYVLSDKQGFYMILELNIVVGETKKEEGETTSWAARIKNPRMSTVTLITNYRPWLVIRDTRSGLQISRELDRGWG
ncbi:hypothetical protein BDZ97DRAFT_1754167 [Flammula alnicola]|nr:hypothetical protein BDZ97DRAFT_1754167 [Flammula alnicola]